MARQVSYPFLTKESAESAGTGKTMLVKAVANATSASFIRVVGSEFVQKYLGEVRPPALHRSRGC